MDKKQLIEKAKSIAPLVIDSARYISNYAEEHFGNLPPESEKQRQLVLDSVFFFLLSVDFLTYGIFGNSDERNVITDNLYWAVLGILTDGFDDAHFLRSTLTELYRQFGNDMYGFTLFNEEGSKDINKTLQWKFAKRVFQLFGKWPADIGLMLGYIAILNAEIKNLDVTKL